MSQPPPITLTDRVRRFVGSALAAVGAALYRMGIHPDAVTAFGLLLVAIAAVFIGRGEMFTGGLILLLGLPFDALDGAVARAMQRRGHFGAVFDSTLDRYADGFIFSALGYHFALQDRHEMLLLSLAAMIGSFLVSYVRARADDAKVAVSVKVGLFTRMERVVVILMALLLPDLLNFPLLLDIGVGVLAVGTNITALHRLWYVQQALLKRNDDSTEKT